MITFIEFQGLNEDYEFKCLNESEFIELNEAERKQVDYAIFILENHLKSSDELDEGLFSSVIGGLSGFLVGPMIGKVIARVLGVDKGLLYNLLTSKMVSTAMGAAIGDYLSSGKIKSSD